MAQRKTAATAVRQHSSYLSSAASHQYEHGNMTTDLNRPICVLISTAEHKTEVTSECQHPSDHSPMPSHRYEHGGMAT